MAYIAYYLVALAFAIGAANGLTCYSCNSSDSARCSIGFTSITFPTEECTGTLISAKCYKITAKDKDGKDYVARGCHTLPTVTCDALTTTSNWLSKLGGDQNSLTNVRCDFCETDKCNTATRVAGFTVFGLVMAALAFLF